MRCDVIAEGVVAAAREVELHVPLVVRLEGTNVELGKKILADSDLTIVSADNLADAAEKVVKAVREAARCPFWSPRTTRASVRASPARRAPSPPSRRTPTAPGWPGATLPARGAPPMPPLPGPTPVP